MNGPEQSESRRPEALAAGAAVERERSREWSRVSASAESHAESVTVLCDVQATGRGL
jgi:hypothetical protein